MSVAQSYSVEHRTPPTPLVALVGCNEHHHEITEYFLQLAKTAPTRLCSISCTESLEQFMTKAFGKEHSVVLIDDHS